MKWIGLAVIAVGVIAVVGIAATNRSTPPPPPTTVAIAPTTIVPTTVAATPVAEQGDDATAEEDDAEDDDDDEDEADEDESDDDEDDEDDEDESDGDESDDDTTTTPARTPRAPAASAGAAAARRMLLDACWRDQFEGETAPPSARWTFDFQLDASGTATNVRITGPTDAVYADFRRCVVSRVGQYRSPEGNAHVALTLP